MAAIGQMPAYQRIGVKWTGLGRSLSAKSLLLPYFGKTSPEYVRFLDLLIFHFLTLSDKASRVHKTIPQNKFQIYSALETYWTKGQTKNVDWCHFQKITALISKVYFTTLPLP
jgi:hypothetical protein